MSDAGVNTMRVQDLDPELRPQEKALKYGVDSLHNYELLALILRAGQPGMPITDLTYNLLGGVEGSLVALGNKSHEEIMAVKGMGVVKSLQVAAIMALARRYFQQTNSGKIIKSSKDIDMVMRPEIATKPFEEIWLLTLNRRHEVLGKHFLTRGSAAASIFDIKNCIKTALVHNAQSIILCHNHPSGNLIPSPQDDQITHSLFEAARIMDLRMLDHVILSTEGYYSYQDQGRLR